MAANFTPIDYLINPRSPSKEVEPTTFSQTENLIEVKDPVREEIYPYVEMRPEKVNLPAELKDMGVEEVGNSKFEGAYDVELPISDEKVEKGLHAPITSSLRWLAEICVYILRRAHLALKTSHGKVVRTATH